MEPKMMTYEDEMPYPYEPVMEMGEPAAPEYFHDLEGVLGRLGAMHFKARFRGKPPEECEKAEKQVLHQANLTAKIAHKSMGKAYGKGGYHPLALEIRRIRQWAKSKGYDPSKLKIESVRWFHKRVLELANLKPRHPYFSELEKPGPLETNMQMWGEWPQTTLVVLKGILATVNIKTLGAVNVGDPSYLSMVDRLLSNATFKYKIDQSESVPILLKNLPSAGGAFALRGQESNGWPVAENIRRFQHPVYIEGGIQFFSEVNVDTDAFTVMVGNPPQPTPIYDGAELYVTMELDATWVRHTG